ncbi:MAG: amino-acid N-acetyltransferase [Microbacterium sp.]|nr:amino-acid N-acetyltransferase [Microbacterium sp.]
MRELVAGVVLERDLDRHEHSFVHSCCGWVTDDRQYSGAVPDYTVRPARTSDVRGILELLEPWVARRILLGKEVVTVYESVQEFVVAESDGVLVGCGALHVMWEDLGEVRTLIVADEWLHHGVGGALVERLEQNALALGLSRLFCLTFEVDFFTRRGFAPIGEQIVDANVYSQLLRSPDEGVAEFLDLAHVKPNTLGNTRMLKQL